MGFDGLVSCLVLLCFWLESSDADAGRFWPLGTASDCDLELVESEDILDCVGPGGGLYPPKFNVILRDTPAYAMSLSRERCDVGVFVDQRLMCVVEKPICNRCCVVVGG